MGVDLQWTVTLPPGLNVPSASELVSNSVVTREIDSDGFMFRADYSGHKAW